jgi:predicted  nucleic acid-binding Zn-ribbon protein
MFQSLMVVLLLAAVAPGAMGQISDSQTLGAILEEIRQLRQDVTAMTVVAQRVQILLYRVQLQENVVNRSRERFDVARVAVEDVERNRVEVTGSIKQQEEKVRSVQDAGERAALEESVRDLKRTLETWAREEMPLRSREAEASDEFRREETKLRELQERLSRLESQLEAYPAPGARR